MKNFHDVGCLKYPISPNQQYRNYCEQYIGLKRELTIAKKVQKEKGGKAPITEVQNMTKNTNSNENNKITEIPHTPSNNSFEYYWS